MPSPSLRRVDAVRAVWQRAPRCVSAFARLPRVVGVRPPGGDRAVVFVPSAPAGRMASSESDEPPAIPLRLHGERLTNAGGTKK